MKTNKNLLTARNTIKKLRKELAKYRRAEKRDMEARRRIRGSGMVSSDGHDGRPW